MRISDWMSDVCSSDLPTIGPMVYTVTVWAIRIFVLIAVLARFGVQTASIVAVLAAGGLAIGLALQGTLQNIAAGIMLLALRPLRAGESISVVGKRSEERRVGKECVSTCRSRWSQDH